ncbi:MAG: DUF2975 domain-containing protein [Bacteroidetes bacterium]|nr:DUF2975 domain-containing protein [Bacteroidota bacterium]
MKFFNNSAKKTYGILSIVLGMTLAMFTVQVVLFILSLIKGESIPSPFAFPVNIFMTNNHYFANEAKDIYLGEISGQVLFFKPSLALQLYSGVYTIIIWAAVSYIVFLIRKIIRTVIDGNPFTNKNGIRLKTAGAVVILVPIILWLSRLLIASSIISSIKIENVKLAATGLADITYLCIGAGMFLIVLSEVFRIGTSLKEENELTV